MISVIVVNMGLLQWMSSVGCYGMVVVHKWVKESVVFLPVLLHFLDHLELVVVLGALLLELVPLLSGGLFLLVLHFVFVMEFLEFLLEAGVEFVDIDLFVVVGLTVGLGLVERGFEGQLFLGFGFVFHFFIALDRGSGTSSLGL